MPRKVLAALTALSFALATITPTAAIARDRDGGWRGGDRHYYDGDRWDRRHRHRHDDNGDAIAAGIVGLALGAILVGAATAGRDDAPMPPPPPQDDGYYDRDGRYDGPPPPDAYGEPAPSYDDGAACVREVRQYDPTTDRYVWVNLRTEC